MTAGRLPMACAACLQHSWNWHQCPGHRPDSCPAYLGAQAQPQRGACQQALPLARRALEVKRLAIKALRREQGQGLGSASENMAVPPASAIEHRQALQRPWQCCASHCKMQGVRRVCETACLPPAKCGQEPEVGLSGRDDPAHEAHACRQLAGDWCTARLPWHKCLLRGGAKPYPCLADQSKSWPATHTTGGGGGERGGGGGEGLGGGDGGSGGLGLGGGKYSLPLRKIVRPLLLAMNVSAGPEVSWPSPPPAVQREHLRGHAQRTTGCSACRVHLAHKATASYHPP